jgi:hypothetical protein
MKVHLHINPEEAMSGYTNICLGYNHWKEEVDVRVSDAEAKELIANNILEYVKLSDVLNTLEYLISKIRHGGRLIISGTDIDSVAQDYCQHKLTIEELNILIHGDQRDISNVKLVTLSMNDLISFLTKSGFNILRKTYHEYIYIIEAQRQ